MVDKVLAAVASLFRQVLKTRFPMDSKHYRISWKQWQHMTVWFPLAPCNAIGLCRTWGLRFWNFPCPRKVFATRNTKLKFKSHIEKNLASSARPSYSSNYFFMLRLRSCSLSIRSATIAHALVMLSMLQLHRAFALVLLGYELSLPKEAASQNLLAARPCSSFWKRRKFKDLVASRQALLKIKQIPAESLSRGQSQSSLHVPWLERQKISATLLDESIRRPPLQTRKSKSATMLESLMSSTCTTKVE